MGIDFKGYKRSAQKEEVDLGVDIMINDIYCNLILEKSNFH